MSSSFTVERNPDEAHYKAKLIFNLNLKTIAEMKKKVSNSRLRTIPGRGRLFENAGPRTRPLLAGSSVLMQYQNKGYALLSF